MTSKELSGQKRGQNISMSHRSPARQCTEATAHRILQHGSRGVSLPTRINTSQSRAGSYYHGGRQPHHAAELPGNLELRGFKQGRLQQGQAWNEGAQSHLAGPMTGLEILRS